METLQDLIDEAETKGHFSIRQVEEFTDRCLQNKNGDNDPDYDSDSSRLSRNDAYKLFNAVMQCPSDGTPSDYHDYAVTFAKAGDYTLACKILKQGLDKYSTHVDLLSDFLAYAIWSSEENHYEMCEEIYERLKARRSFWQWRAYDFSIDYLLNMIDRGRDDPEKIKDECLKLASEFQTNLPTDERGYVAEAQIYSIFGESTKEKMTLEKAFDKENIPIGRVGVSLALICLEQREPDKAMKCIERVLKDMPNRDYANIKPSRALLLLMKSKISMLMKKWEASGVEIGQSVDIPLLKEIAEEWDKVKKISDSTGQAYNDIKTLVEFVKAISGESIDVDEE